MNGNAFRAPVTRDGAISAFVPRMCAFLLFFSVGTARAAKRVVSFGSTGDVCLDDDSVETAVESLRTIEGEPAITLIGYSDATDVRKRMKLDERCLSRTIPLELTGHTRVAAARALHVYEIANKAGVPGFDAPPVFQIALGESEVSTNSEVVTLITRRAAAEDPYSRRVEMVVREIPEPEPATAPTVVVNPADINIDGQPVVDELARRRANLPRVLRAIGWTEFGVGMGVAALGGAFLISGAIQHDVAYDTLDPDRSALLEADGYRYVRAGGWALAVGGGLVIGGIATLVIARKLDGRQRTSAKHVAINGRGIGVRW